MKIILHQPFLTTLLVISICCFESCKKKTEPIPDITTPFCPITKVFFGDKEDSLMLQYTLTVSENPREFILVMNEDIDLAESDTRKAKFQYFNDYFVYYVYDSNGNEIGKADTTWGTMDKPIHSVEYTLGNSGYDTLITNNSYNGNLLTSSTTKYNSNSPSTTFFYYNGEDCIKKINGSSSATGFSDTTTIEYTYTTIGYDKNLFKNKYGYVFFQFGNYGSKLLASAVVSRKSYCPWGSCGTNSDSEIYDYKIEGNTLIQKLIRPGITLFQRYETSCD